MLDGGGGYYCTKYKRPYEDMGSSSWYYQYITDPISMQNFVYEWVHFSIFSEVCRSQNWLKSKKIWKTKNNNFGNFVTILTKIGSVGIWMGHFFLESWYMYGSCFKFPAACPYQNQTWVTSPQMMAALLSVVIWMRYQISQDPTSVQNVVSPKCRFPTSGVC